MVMLLTSMITRATPTTARGGWKSLNFLIDRGFCADGHDFFVNLWPKMHHHWPDFAHPVEAVATIRAAGGVPILARPGASLGGGHQGGYTVASTGAYATIC